jgi:acyl-CoA thioesterase YciA
MTQSAVVHTFPNDLSPIIRTKTTMSDANPAGDICGGWILAQMDLAGGVAAYGYVGNRVVTVAVDSMSFHHPVFVGDDISFYTDIARVGTTSIAVKISAWVKRPNVTEPIFVTEGVFTFVSVDKDNKPQKIKKEGVK